MIDEALRIHSISLFVNIGDVLFHLSILISSSKVHKAWGAIGKLLISRAKLCFACSDGKLFTQSSVYSNKIEFKIQDVSRFKILF